MYLLPVSARLLYCITHIVSKVKKKKFTSRIKTLMLNYMFGHHYIMLTFDLTHVVIWFVVAKKHVYAKVF